MGSACQADTDGPSCKDVRGIENGAIENGHVVVADAEEWREDLPNGHCVPTGTQRVDEQKEPQEPTIRWERFLPVKTLRVLLVENDDSTRQVVSALLRKCCYEVMSSNDSMSMSSWTKRAVEIDSPQPMSPDQLADPPDSTCAQVIHPKSEICSNKWLPTANKRNGKKQKENNDESMGKYLEIGALRNSSVEYQSSLNDMPGNPTEKQHETHMTQTNSKNKVMVENDGATTLTEPNTQTADLISSIARNAETNQAVRITDIHGSPSEMSDGNGKNCGSHVDMMSHGLGLKRLKTAVASTENHDERNILRRSDLSAFTRYHTSVASNHGGAGFGESCSPQDNSSEAVKTDSTCKMKSDSDAAPVKQGSNGSSNNNDMGSSTKNVVAKPSVNRERVTSPSAVKSTQHTSAFHPVQHQTSPVNQQPSIDRGSSDAQCGSSNVFDPPVECHAANYSVNGAISGSHNHNRSNGQNGCSAAPNIARPNIESVNGIMAKNGAGNGSGSGSGSGNDMYHNRYPQREAALNKFRLKRKDRNFGKKVRYQSRKKMADQRPRVRGQFVRQIGQGDQAGQENR
ncbi:hypothetical protein PR202_ga26119 [Eleusine coracana subsp. coracana]|uniref:CCT domain-containing protein n=1 Tax=Eleusine coracana subsp. coracana TaxID=191504 RepID=A0AAV5DCR9_ELECO|nr:hypothetical protein PR202_ga26119 [Eleusine coracana subsp. coracana]